MDFEQDPEDDKSFELPSGSSSSSASEDEEDENNEFDVSSDSESEDADVSEIALPTPPPSLIIGTVQQQYSYSLIHVYRRASGGKVGLTHKKKCEKSHCAKRGD